MHYFTILLMWSICTVSVHCKPAYKMKVFRAEVTKTTKEYAEGRLWMSKPDRYTNAVNGELYLYNIPRDTKVRIKLYEFLSNEYRPFAINLERDLCSYLQLEYKMIPYPDLMKAGAHVPEPRCPIKPGNYSVANATATIENYPPGMPFHNWMLRCEFLHGTVEMLTLQFYGVLDRDAVIRERYG